MARLRDVDVFTTAEFSARTTRYWMFGTGAGVTVIMAAVLGLLVGVVVVAQTIYAATIDHIREFGTLKAMGATNATSTGSSWSRPPSARRSGTGWASWWPARWHSRAAMAAPISCCPARCAPAFSGSPCMMCVSAAMVSINKVTRIDPAMVFKG